MNARQALGGVVPQSPLEAGQGGEATQHYVWESRFGVIVIDVVDGIAYVNGERVEAVKVLDEQSRQD